MKKPRASVRSKIYRVLGPGLITGASDDDPSGIATYSQAGAQFGYALGWTLLFSYPLMCAIQEISARVGRTTGRGLAGNLRQYYPVWILRPVVALLVVANTINIGANLGAMGDALALLVGGPRSVYALGFGVACASAEIFTSYRSYSRLLRWLTLALLAYCGTAFVVDVPWGQALHGIVVPDFRQGASYWTTIVAVLGTTISPYLFFWQASQEAEDTKDIRARQPLRSAPRQAADAFERIRLDTYVGMAISNIVALAIMVTAAVTLHPAGITHLESSAQAAEALQPIAGRFAAVVFTLGIIGTGLLAVPVLAGSAAYAVGEAFNWRTGLSRVPMQAKAFYAVVALATMLGALLNLTPINPIRALYWSAVVNGVVAVPVMVMMMVVTADSRLMGQFPVRGTLRVVGWMTTAVMAASVVGMAITFLEQGAS